MLQNEQVSSDCVLLIDEMEFNIMDETTSTTILSYFTNEAAAAAAFLKVIDIWWIMSNSKSKYNTHNRFGNAATPNDKKIYLFVLLPHGLKSGNSYKFADAVNFHYLLKHLMHL